MVYSHNEICTAVKINKLQLQATTWMHLTNKVLSKECKTQKSTHSLNLFIYNSKKKAKLYYFRMHALVLKSLRKARKLLLQNTG